MKLLYYECKKIVTNHIIMIVLLLSILCNIAFLGFNFNQNEAIAEPLISDTKTIAQQEELVQKERIENYPVMIDNIVKEAIKSSKSTLFSTPGSFNHTKLLKKINLYSEFEGKTLPYHNRVGISNLFQSKMVKIMSVLLMVLICLFTFAQEFEEGHMTYIKPLKHARNKLIMIKLFAVLITCISVVAILYLSSVVFLSITYGNIWMDGSIQELIGMIRSTWNISIMQYTMLYICMLLFMITTFIAIISCICNVLKNTVYSIFAITVFVLIEVAFYTLIAKDSYLSMLHFVNVISLLDINVLFSDYYVTNLAGQPVSMLLIVILVFIIIGSICFIISIKAFNSNKGLHRFSIKSFQKKGKLHHIGYYEAYKFLFVKKALAIFMVFMVFSIYTYHSFEIYESPDVFYYRVYSKKLAGQLSDKKEQILKKQNDTFDSYKAEMTQLSNDYHAFKINKADFDQQFGLLSKKLVSENGFRRAEYQYQQLKADNKTVYIDETPYTLLLGKESYRGYILLFIYVLLVLILSLSGLMAIEFETKMCITIQTMRDKFTKINKIKYLFAFIFASVVYLVSFLSDIYVKYISSNGSGLLEPVGNLLFLQIDSNIPIWLFILLMIITGLLLVVLATILILYISKKTKKTSYAMLCSMFILLPFLMLLLF